MGEWYGTSFLLAELFEHNRKDDDSATFLTTTITPFLLLVFTVFLMGVQLVGQPIECWCPAMTSGAQCNYTRSICWVSKTYVIHYDQEIPREQDVKESVQKREMTFYPLIPFYLLILNCLLLLPSWIRAVFRDEGGIEVVRIVRHISLDPRSEERKAQGIAEIFSLYIKKHGSCNKTVMGKLMMFVSACGFFPLGSKYGTYQTGLLLLSRLLSLGAIIASFSLLGMLLDVNFVHWGWSVVRDLAENGHVTDMNVFPRETLCDFEIRQLQNVHRYTVQCIMPINMWSEKIFLFLWFWLVLLCLVNLYDYQYWVRKLLPSASRRELLSKHLTIVLYETRELACEDHAQDEFISRFCAPDIVLQLRKLEIAIGNCFVSEVMRCLWEEYQQEITGIEVSSDGVG